MNDNNQDESIINKKVKRSFKKLNADDSFMNKDDISNINYESKVKSDDDYSKSDSEEYESDDYAPLDNENKGNDLDEENEFEEENDSEDQEESEDTDEELMREYEKIKKMREEEKKKLEEQNAEKLKKQAEEQLLLGNPLVNVSGYSLKKKWFEDTVFKNQSKSEPKTLKRFVNDTVRSDFHRKFLSKSIQ